MNPTIRSRALGFCLSVISIAATGAGAQADVLHDDFDDDRIDPETWATHVYGAGPQLAEVHQQLEITLPGWSSGADFGAKLTSNFVLRGDFDIQVDFRLLTWPFGNGVRTALGLDWGFLYPPGVERISFGRNDYSSAPRESYLTDFTYVCGITSTSDLTGTLRLVRTGNSQTGYRASPGGWVAICTGPAPSDDVHVQLSAFSAYQFQGWDVKMAFDDFVVTTGTVIWPSTPVERRTWGCLKALYR